MSTEANVIKPLRRIGKKALGPENSKRLWEFVKKGKSSLYIPADEIQSVNSVKSYRKATRLSKHAPSLTDKWVLRLLIEEYDAYVGHCEEKVIDRDALLEKVRTDFANLFDEEKTHHTEFDIDIAVLRQHFTLAKILDLVILELFSVHEDIGRRYIMSIKLEGLPKQNYTVNHQLFTKINKLVLDGDLTGQELTSYGDISQLNYTNVVVDSLGLHFEYQGPGTQLPYRASRKDLEKTMFKFATDRELNKIIRNTDKIHWAEYARQERLQELYVIDEDEKHGKVIDSIGVDGFMKQETTKHEQERIENEKENEKTAIKEAYLLDNIDGIAFKTENEEDFADFINNLENKSLFKSFRKRSDKGDRVYSDYDEPVEGRNEGPGAGVSDEGAVYGFRDATSITISLVRNHQDGYDTPDGAFFKYFNMTKMNLERYGVFKQYKEDDYIDNCFVSALYRYAETHNTLDKSVMEEVKKMLNGNLHVPMKVMSVVADLLQHKIIINNVKYTSKYNVYGKEYDAVIQMGLIDSHYFINELTEYTSYSVQNYHEVCHLKCYNEIDKSYIGVGGDVLYHRNAKKFASSIKVMTLLVENKKSLLKLISKPDMYNAKTQFFTQVPENFDNLEFCEKMCTKPVVGKNERNAKVMSEEELLKGDGKYDRIIAFDFETGINNPIDMIHIPYLCCSIWIDAAGVKHTRKFKGIDCATLFLNSVPDKSLLIAHNATYDYRFIVKHVNQIREISKGTRLMTANGKYFEKKITVKCSYNLMSYRLDRLNDMFHLEMGGGKEVIEHSLYTMENVENKYYSIDLASKMINPDLRTKFLENIHDWGLEREDGTYDIVEYSAIYCVRDCDILINAYTKFREMVVKSVQLDVNNILTIPSLAHAYLKREGCYDEVLQIGGISQRFIQKSIVGGCVMSNNNKMIKCDEVLNDFDAVSLYPSAMSEMGFLKGKPKVLTDLSKEFLKTVDGYFVEILITKVSKNLPFPVMSFKNKQKIRNWTNNMVGEIVIVNKISLEDLVEFQGVEYKILKGYYFDEGRNYTIGKVITTLFNERLKYKKMQNPIQEIYKLIMNSGYGKTIMKEIKSDIRNFDNRESFERYLSKNYNYIESYIEYGQGKYKVEIIKSINQHFNIAHVGSEILSYAKRIMNEVMSLAHDNDVKVFYTDTDSIHLRDADIPKLENAYAEKYDKVLIGSKMRQFHTDFDIGTEKCHSIVSTKSIFLGKKCYIDLLRGVSVKTGEFVQAYHVRMKGISNKSIVLWANENGHGDNLMGVYEWLFSGNSCTFDLYRGGNLNFKFNKDYSIHTDPMFLRKLQFLGDKDNGKIPYSLSGVIPHKSIRKSAQ